MNATETVRKAMGREACACGTNYQTGNLIHGDTHYHGPDPLADTPEGWWEFGQIMEWAREQGWRWELDENGIWWCIRDASGFGASFIDRWEVWVDPEPDHLTERQARIEALAEAVGGTE